MGSGTRILIYVPPEDLAMIDAGAERAGVSRSEYLREAGLARARGGGVLLPEVVAARIREIAARAGEAPDVVAALLVGTAIGQLYPEGGSGPR